jgi:dihydroorotate dehydrogenase
MLYPVLRPLLFSVDPERVHRLAIEALRAGGRLPIRRLPGACVDLMGLRFPNRLGLAAGFDKNAEAVDGLGRLGFGFIEVGTVTLRPQSGQDRPRLFRLPRANALVNRMGFPNDGAVTVSKRLRRRRYRGIVGVNIGKNTETPLDQAIDDYIGCLRVMHDVSDYIAINISSPNTRSLRELHAPERLEQLLSGLVAERDKLVGDGRRPLPLLLKISPDLDIEAVKGVARVVKQASLDGIIATNTTVRRDATDEYAVRESGGLSGAPLHRTALAMVTTVRRLVGPECAIIGVGGVDSPAKAAAMRAAGADLVQIYTGLVFRGPAVVERCVSALSRQVPTPPENR